MRTFFVEVTDMFGGELNYGWVHYYGVIARSEYGATRVVSRHTGLNFRFDGTKYVSKSGNTAWYFVECPINSDRHVDINGKRGVNHG